MLPGAFITPSPGRRTAVASTGHDAGVHELGGDAVEARTSRPPVRPRRAFGPDLAAFAIAVGMVVALLAALGVPASVLERLLVLGGLLSAACAAEAAFMRQEVGLGRRGPARRRAHDDRGRSEAERVLDDCSSWAVRWGAAASAVLFGLALVLAVAS